jgi:hypothetical protein
VFLKYLTDNRKKNLDLHLAQYTAANFLHKLHPSSIKVYFNTLHKGFLQSEYLVSPDIRLQNYKSAVDS